MPSSPDRAPSRPAPQAGMSLLEMMVALLVLAFGVLGLVALQTRTLKANVSALQRSQASMLSHYILDVMRVDRAEAQQGAYNTGDELRCAVVDPPSDPTLAQATVESWFADVKSSMGDHATTCIQLQCANDYTCSVLIQWDDSGAGGLPEQQMTISSRI